MKVDNPNMHNGIENLVPDTDAAFPEASKGELFYLDGHVTLPNGLYCYEEGNWHQVLTLNNVAIKSGYRDLMFPLASAKSAGVNHPTWANIAGGISAWSFKPNKTNDLQLSYHINHDHKPSTGLYPHFHWFPTSALAGRVRFGFEFIRAKGHQQQIFPLATTTIYLEQDSTGILQDHHIIEATEILAAQIEPDTILLVRIFRDGTHASDTYPDNVFITQVDCHYLADRNATVNKEPPFDA